MGFRKTVNKKRVLVVFCHPGKESLNHAIRDALVAGLERSEADVRIEDLYRERFNPLLFDSEENDRDRVTIHMKSNVVWADWLVYITPLWWAGLPAMLKGYFDRIFTENFSFKYNQAGIPEGLLDGKKAILCVTCDTPPVILSLSRRTQGLKSVNIGILKLCGVKKSKYKLFGSVLNSTEEKRRKWIEKAAKIGEKIGKPDTAFQLFTRKLSSFMKAVRVSLYSFVFCSVLLGSAIGMSIAHNFSWSGFLLAIIIGLFAHIAVSFSNEVTDEPNDRINANRTVFSGGTGLLLKGIITRTVLNRGWIISSIVALLIPTLMIMLFGYHWLLLFGLGFALFLGLEYSLPPFRFAQIGAGEAAAFIAYGVPLMLVGLTLQVGNPHIAQIVSNYRFYLLALPVSLSVFTTLCLTQIPDTDADKTVGKKSISVMIGPKNVLILSASSSMLCVALFTIFIPTQILSPGFAVIALALPLFTGIFIFTNLNTYKIPAGKGMINIMGMSVISSILCAVVPAIYHFLYFDRIATFY
jgi:NAD(P)H dehydrogenase (quinone)